MTGSGVADGAVPPAEYRRRGPHAWVRGVLVVVAGLLLAVLGFAAALISVIGLGIVVMLVGWSLSVPLRAQVVRVEETGLTIDRPAPQRNLPPYRIDWAEVVALDVVASAAGRTLRVSTRDGRRVLLPAPWSFRRRVSAEFGRIAERWRAAGGSGELGRVRRRPWVRSALAALVALAILGLVVHDAPWRRGWFAGPEATTLPRSCAAPADGVMRRMALRSDETTVRAMTYAGLVLCRWSSESGALLGEGTYLKVSYELYQDTVYDSGAREAHSDLLRDPEAPPSGSTTWRLHGVGDEADAWSNTIDGRSGEEGVQARRANVLVNVAFIWSPGDMADPSVRKDVQQVARQALAQVPLR